MTSVNLEFLSSLNLSDLTRLVSSHPQAVSILEPPKSDEKGYDRERKARKRAAERDLKIPSPVNRKNRERALEDAEFFLRHYFGNVFSEPFTPDRLDMLQSIENAALYGGDQAIAGPRGEGKTRLVLYQGLRLALKNISRFPIVIGKSQSKAEKDLKTIREKLQQNKEFIADFPEIGYPFRAIGGWSSRCRLQTVAGEFTQIEIAPDHLIFPTIRPEQLEWGNDYEISSCGQIFACMGIDGPIRGTTFRDERPSVAIIDDIEDKEAARSETLIERNESIIEEDIGGLGSSAEPIARVFLCTIQNRKCLAYKYTDTTQKPSWRGRRYRKMIKPPDRMDLVEQFIDLWKNRKSSDIDARESFRFWRDNKDAIEAGCEISNPHSYSKKIHADGEPMELSAIHSYYVRVAKYGAKAVATEIDNDPPEEAGPQGSGLTPDIVSSRINGLSKRQLPANTRVLTAAIDLGKYYCHWVVCAWWEGAGGCVVDYGFASVLGTDRSQDHIAAEPHIYQCLLNWRDELLQKQFVDATGTEHRIQHVLVDSGTFTPAAYEFCRQVRGPFHPSKGIANYRQKKMETNRVFVGENLHAEYFPAHDIALYELDTDYWKQWVHERFLTPTFDENNMLRRGSLSLYQSDSKHSLYSQHITAEELVTEFKEGKGSKTFWNRRREDNHWLDATYMAAAASQIYGIKLLGQSEIEVQPKHVEKSTERKPVRPQHGNRFKQRPGGWIPKRR